MNQKVFWRSKTFWWNALSIITAVASVYGYKVNKEVSEQTFQIVMIANPVINLILRFFTEKKLTTKSIPAKLAKFLNK